MEHNRLFNEFFDALFKHSNVFSQKEHKQRYIDYEINYGKFLPAQRSSRVLDIGCGTGHFLYFLKKKGYTDFTGIDISPQQVDFCKQNISERVEVADAFEFLAKKNNYYDVIVANNLLEHIPKTRIIELLSLVKDALRSKGIFLMETSNLGNPFAVRLRYADFTHTVGFTERSLYQVFWYAGFRNIQILPSRQKGIAGKVLRNTIYFFLTKLFWYQGFNAPNILSPLLIGVARKQDNAENQIYP